MQDAYVRAYQHLDQFAGRALFSTWLTRIAVHESLSRIRLRNRNQQLDDSGQDGEISMKMVETSPDPTDISTGTILSWELWSLPQCPRH
jgi:RNA polymerase sigma-70 factor (ECF subfamily)